MSTRSKSGASSRTSTRPSPAGRREAHPATLSSKLIGWHGKGLYSGQGRLLFSNNGEHGRLAETNPDVPSGALAEWRGAGDWQLVRRNQFTEITGPGGIYGGEHPDTDPIWAVGWDRRSLILMLLDGGQWRAYRLPKATHTYDGGHGWYTEWPRIRDIGEGDLLMTMHGMFWRFPKTFSAANSAGLAPRSTYLKVLGDFCRWNDRIVLGCDDAARIEVPRKMKGELAKAGQSQSNLQFLKPPQLDEFGPPLGRGAVWLDDAVKAGEASDPFLFSGFAYRTLFLTHDDAEPVTFTLEVDGRGNGDWKKLRDIEAPAGGSTWTEFNAGEIGAWVRLKANRDCAKATAYFHYRNADRRSPQAAELFTGLARPGDAKVSGGVLYDRGGNARTLQCIAADGKSACYELDGDLKLRRADDPASVAWARTNLAIPRGFLTADSASVVCVENNHRWRLPKGEASFEQPGAGRRRAGLPRGRHRARSVQCLRHVLRIAGRERGRFRQDPSHRHAQPAHQGLCQLSRPAGDERRRRRGRAGGHIVRSDDGKCGLWVGALRRSLAVRQTAGQRRAVESRRSQGQSAQRSLLDDRLRSQARRPLAFGRRPGKDACRGGHRRHGPVGGLSRIRCAGRQIGAAPFSGCVRRILGARRAGQGHDGNRAVYLRMMRQPLQLPEQPPDRLEFPKALESCPNPTMKSR